MKVHVRAVSTFAKPWIEIDGDSRDVVLSRLKSYVATAIGRSFVDLAKAGVDKATMMRTVFSGDGKTHAFVCDIKWNEGDTTTERYVVTLTKSDVQQELLTRMVTE